MKEKQFRTILVDALKSRALPDTGFEEIPGMGYRPDATAWAVVALSNVGLEGTFLKDASSWLARDQFEDGRISISRQNPEAFWVTPLAVLAWGGSREHGRNLSGAVDFLLGTSGKHWEKRVDSVYGHDPKLRGWSWTEGTHSWIEPTALAIIALRSTGHGGHPRVSEAVEMLLDRQLPEGGWNYGNTSVFGTMLHPMPAPTGLALQALSGVAPDTDVSDSLSYLGSLLGRLQTPLSLGWALLGLGAWGFRPDIRKELLAACVKRRETYGPYTTSHLSLLLLASLKPGGFLDSQ